MAILRASSNYLPPLHPEAGFSHAQLQSDALLHSFSQEAMDARSTSAMVLGALCNPFARMGVLSFASHFTPRTFPILTMAAQTLGLATEVTAFEGVNTLLSSENLSSSFSERWKVSFLHFGILKMMGHAFQSQNVFLRHFTQSSAMVAGEEMTGRLGFTARNHESLSERLFHAEATNLKLGFSMALAHRLLPGIHALERNLEGQALQLCSPIRGAAPRLTLASMHSVEAANKAEALKVRAYQNQVRLDVRHQLALAVAMALQGVAEPGALARLYFSPETLSFSTLPLPAPTVDRTPVELVFRIPAGGAGLELLSYTRITLQSLSEHVHTPQQRAFYEALLDLGPLSGLKWDLPAHIDLVAIDANLRSLLTETSAEAPLESFMPYVVELIRQIESLSEREVNEVAAVEIQRQEKFEALTTLIRNLSRYSLFQPLTIYLESLCIARGLQAGESPHCYGLKAREISLAGQRLYLYQPAVGREILIQREAWEGKDREAWEKLRNIVRYIFTRNSLNFDGWRRSGEVLANLGDPTALIRRIQESEQRSGNNFQTVMGLLFFLQENSLAQRFLRKGRENVDPRARALYLEFDIKNWGLLGQKEEALKLWEELQTQDGDEFRKINVLVDLAFQGRREEALQALRTFLGHKDPQIVNWVLSRMMKLGERDQVLPFLMRQASVADNEQLASILRGLKNYGDETALSFAILMFHHSDASVKREAAWLLCALGRADLAGEFLFSLNFEDISWLIDLAHSGQYGNESSKTRLLVLLKNKNANVLCEAIRALGEYGDPRVIPQLLPLLGNENLEIALAAAQSLAELGEVNAVRERLTSLLEEEIRRNPQAISSKMNSILRALNVLGQARLRQLFGRQVARI